RSMVAGQLRNGAAGDVVDARMTLSNGCPAHLVGSFHDAGVSRGLIISGVGPMISAAADASVEPVFQPIRRLADLSVAGFEALARFRDANGSLVGLSATPSPVRDGDWSVIGPVMLRKSAEALSLLRSAGRDVFMQVNLSAAEIARPILVEEIAAIISDAKLPRGVLRIELTEEAALRDNEGALGALAAFRAAGAGIVLDDFGAGHSSFAWLVEIPADGVKLDPRLVRLASQPRATRILTGLTGLIRSLGMSVTAEGIEDATTAPRLLAMGCDYVQGFAYDLPIVRGEIERAFERRSAPQ
ncbi:MAG: EAL domain-containing protein, partial [Alphaproteobacteria bacterium]|nr:EAL domain-containing protein [Alphaproteobacteria bacterium]